jgi:hypothetical protein
VITTYVLWITQQGELRRSRSKQFQLIPQGRGGGPGRSPNEVFILECEWLGKGSRRRQVKEFIEEHNLEVVGLQETIRESFTDRELLEIAGSRNFSWKWASTKGRSGGILMGLN